MSRSSMHGSSNVFLIGPMGSGKTAVGRKLARALSLSFYDSDAEIERRTRVDIPLIFEKEGETGFRRREREAIESLTSIKGIVLATGGGAVVSAENRSHLTARGCVVYLQTSVTQQSLRIGSARNRPMLADSATPATRLEQLMNERAALYEEIADIVVSTDGRHVYQVAGHVLREFVARGGSKTVGAYVSHHPRRGA